MQPKTIEQYASIYRCPATNENEYCRHDIISAINFGINLEKKRNKMEKVKVTVNYCDIEFQVKGFYIKGSDEDYTGSCIEDEAIFIQGIDVYEILSTKQWNHIIDLAIQQIED